MASSHLPTIEPGTVRHILLIPTDDIREALIGDGPCGSRVPQVSSHTRGHWLMVGHPMCDWCGLAWPCPDANTLVGKVWTNHAPAMHKDGDALALAWDGRPTGPEGLARALAVLVASGFGASPGWVADFIVGQPALSDLEDLGLLGEARGLWKVEVVRGQH